MFSIKDIKKIILVSAILSNQDLVEECGLSKRHIQLLYDSLVKSLIKTIDEFYEEQKMKKNQIEIDFKKNKKMKQFLINKMDS